MIDKHKEKGSYFIGIDEILTGSFRTGDFLLSQKFALRFDILALAKGISDMTMPMGAVAVSNDVYDQAKKNNSQFLSFTKDYFKNQLGAHNSWYALEAFQIEKGPKNVNRVGPTIQNTLVEEIRGKGLLLFPMGIFGHFKKFC